jgi:hypothetical protein
VLHAPLELLGRVGLLPFVVAADPFTAIVDAPIDVLAASRAITRVAVWSMVHDDPDHAKYVWSHCLTMPQAVMYLAGSAVTARTALAVAATHVTGFRASLSNIAFEPHLLDVPVAGPCPDAEDLATFAASTTTPTW